MEELVDRGLVKHIGVSNFSVSDLKEAQAVMTNCPIVSNQVRYSLMDRAIERELLPYCQESRITVIAYTPLARGSLTHKPRLGGERSVEVLEKVASRVGKTMAQVALNWCT